MTIDSEDSNFLYKSHRQEHMHFGTINEVIMTMIAINEQMEDKKMKTTIYYPRVEIVTAFFVLILSFIVLTAVKAQGSSNKSEGIETKAGLSDEKAIKPIDIGFTKMIANDTTLTLKIRSWMINGSYWRRTDSEETNQEELAQTITKWMSNGSYWSTTENNEFEIERLSFSDKQGKSSDSLVMNDK